MVSVGEKELYCNWEVINDEDESEGKEESCTIKDGGSSSNSTVEEGEKKPSVRPYVRSKMPRLRWTPDLHLRFVQAVERLGGPDRATPKSVLQLMDIKGLKIAHIKSHLQMYRSKKIDSESSQGMADHMLFMEGRGSQLPFLPNHTQGQTSKVRYGDAAYWDVYGKWMGSSTVQLNTSNKTRPGFCSPIIERIFRNHFFRSEASPDLYSKITSLNGESPQETDEHLMGRHGSMLMQESRSRFYQSTDNSSLKLMQQRLNGQRMSLDTAQISPSICQTMRRETAAGSKRKASDFELNLSLSLGLESRNEEAQQGIVLDDDDDQHLNLSLYTRRKKAKSIAGVEKARGVSTLDLTL